MRNNHVDIREKYPDRIPVIVTSKKFNLSKNKFLVPRTMTVGNLIYWLRTRILDIGFEQSLVIFVNDIIPKATETIEEVDVKYRKYEDEHLNIYLTTENTFG